RLAPAITLSISNREPFAERDFSTSKATLTSLRRSGPGRAVISQSTPASTAGNVRDSILRLKPEPGDDHRGDYRRYAAAIRSDSVRNGLLNSHIFQAGGLDHVFPTLAGAGEAMDEQGCQAQPSRAPAPTVPQNVPAVAGRTGETTDTGCLSVD